MEIFLGVLVNEKGERRIVGAFPDRIKAGCNASELIGHPLPGDGFMGNYARVESVEFFKG